MALEEEDYIQYTVYTSINSGRENQDYLDSFKNIKLFSRIKNTGLLQSKFSQTRRNASSGKKERQRVMAPFFF